GDRRDVADGGRLLRAAALRDAPPARRREGPPARRGECPVRDSARAPARTSRRRDPHRRRQALPSALVGRGGARGDLASLDLALGSRDPDGLPHDARPPGASLARAAPTRETRSVNEAGSPATGR